MTRFQRNPGARSFPELMNSRIHFDSLGTPSKNQFSNRLCVRSGRQMKVLKEIIKSKLQASGIDLGVHLICPWMESTWMSRLYVLR